MVSGRAGRIKIAAAGSTRTSNSYFLTPHSPRTLPAGPYIMRVRKGRGTYVSKRRRLHAAGLLCGGAGGGEWMKLNPAVDAFVTGEVKHHEWLAARQAGLTLVDAGHYATEV